MIIMCASNSHSYTHLILALGIVRKPTVWGIITSKYPGTHDIGLPNNVVSQGWLRVKSSELIAASLHANNTGKQRNNRFETGARRWSMHISCTVHVT